MTAVLVEQDMLPPMDITKNSVMNKTHAQGLVLNSTFYYTITHEQLPYIILMETNS
jgi:hypothetical protein